MKRGGILSKAIPESDNDRSNYVRGGVNFCTLVVRL
jgi:hypothetical protein